MTLRLLQKLKQKKKGKGRARSPAIAYFARVAPDIKDCRRRIMSHQARAEFTSNCHFVRDADICMWADITGKPGGDDDEFDGDDELVFDSIKIPKLVRHSHEQVVEFDDDRSTLSDDIKPFIRPVRYKDDRAESPADVENVVDSPTLTGNDTAYAATWSLGLESVKSPTWKVCQRRKAQCARAGCKTLILEVFAGMAILTMLAISAGWPIMSPVDTIYEGQHVGGA